ncbi:MAG: SEL1-like repeat protein [Magnetococcales bacterium]|nr:SEL1-like repeat protein [Magnetococcales bacterium]
MDEIKRPAWHAVLYEGEKVLYTLETLGSGLPEDQNALRQLILVATDFSCILVSLVGEEFLATRYDLDAITSLEEIFPLHLKLRTHRDAIHIRLSDQYEAAFVKNEVLPAIQARLALTPKDKLAFLLRKLQVKGLLRPKPLLKVALGTTLLVGVLFGLSLYLKARPSPVPATQESPASVVSSATTAKAPEDGEKGDATPSSHTEIPARDSEAAPPPAVVSPAKGSSAPPSLPGASGGGSPMGQIAGAVAGSVAKAVMSQMNPEVMGKLIQGVASQMSAAPGQGSPVDPGKMLSGLPVQTGPIDPARFGAVEQSPEGVDLNQIATSLGTQTTQGMDLQKMANMLDPQLRQAAQGQGNPQPPDRLDPQLRQVAQGQGNPQTPDRNHPVEASHLSGASSAQSSSGEPLHPPASRPTSTEVRDQQAPRIPARTGEAVPKPADQSANPAKQSSSGEPLHPPASRPTATEMRDQQAPRIPARTGEAVSKPADQSANPGLSAPTLGNQSPLVKPEGSGRSPPVKPEGTSLVAGTPQQATGTPQQAGVDMPVVPLDAYRRQYPGLYDHLTDQQLAAGLHRRYYRHMPRETYFRQLGLDPKHPGHHFVSLLDYRASYPGFYDDLTDVELAQGLQQKYYPEMTWEEYVALAGCEDPQDLFVARDLAEGLRMAREILAEGETQRAFRVFLRLAQRGSTAAQSGLGFLLSRGIGTLVDKSRAMRWYRKAALQGDVTAQYNLGLLLAAKDIPEHDLKESAFWMQKAAENGDQAARDNLEQFVAH